MPRLTAPLDLPDHDLHVEPWPDPVIDTVGHDPRSPYVERFWLGILGPSTVWLLRRLADQLDAEPAGFDVALPELAAGLGLSQRHGRNSPMQRAVERSCTFGMARYEGGGTLAVRRRLPPLTRRQIERLPEGLQSEHQTWLERDTRRPEAAELKQRARRLALSLLELGETPDDIERQLHRWRFHPALAFDAVRWAGEQTGESDVSPPTPTPTPTPTPGPRPTPRLAAAALQRSRPVITRLAVPTGPSDAPGPPPPPPPPAS